MARGLASFRLDPGVPSSYGRQPMKDGDVVVAAGPARTSPAAANGGASRGATPDGVEKAAPPTGASASDRRAAIIELMRAHGEAVLGFCLRVLGDADLAEEVRQQAFLQAFRDFDRFEERSSRRAWLFGIASHRCLDALRNRKRRARWIDNDEQALMNTHDPGSGPSQRIEHAQIASALEECLKLLSPEVRMTVLLRFQNELTYEELAAQLATRADALQMRVTRALPKLRQCLESKGVYDD